MTPDESAKEAEAQWSGSQKIFDVGQVDVGQVDVGSGDGTVESEIKLRPVLNLPSRPTQSPASSSRKGNAGHSPGVGVPFGLVGEDSTASPELSNDERRLSAATRYNQSSGLYPSERHYPTLEAMQRLYKLFGYVAVGLVFPYLLFRFVYLIWTTDGQLIQELAGFSEFAVPLLFATVALTGTLFAAAEGLRLAMDIQENLLRIANRGGRLKD